MDVSPVVLLNGPREAGKSTLLIKSLADLEHTSEYVTFESILEMVAAANSPVNYLKDRITPSIIDGVQLVPEIFRPLKMVVDELRQEQVSKPKGRYILASSVHIQALTKLTDPLVGRMNVLTLYPISSAEALGGKGDFIGRLFNQDFYPKTDKQKLSDVIRASTFPEISGAKVHEITTWFDNYLSTILLRDVFSLSKIGKPSILHSLLMVLANHAGRLVNDADIARSTGLNSVTSRNYKALLKMLFLTFELSPWYRNIGKRFVKAPKGYMTDTMLLCHLLQYELDDLEKKRPQYFGHIFDNFVATELLKLMTFQNKYMTLSHFRTSDNTEVDFVLEKTDGKLTAVEVKQRDSLTSSDFKGLKELQRLTGKDFICGIVLYQGRDVVPFGHNLWAVPISNLWG